MARELGVPFDEIRDGLAAFTGAERRLEPKGEAGASRSSTATPTTRPSSPPTCARRATSGAVSATAGSSRSSSRTCTQRTRFFADEFGAALGLADEAIVLDVYGPARIPSRVLRGRWWRTRCRSGRSGGLRTASGRGARPVAGMARPGDIVLTMGAGDVTELGPRIVAELAAR